MKTSRPRALCRLDRLYLSIVGSNFELIDKTEKWFQLNIRSVIFYFFNFYLIFTQHPFFTMKVLPRFSRNKLNWFLLLNSQCYAHARIIYIFSDFLLLTTKFSSIPLTKWKAKMLKVDNFLIIFSLEVGGKFIGWFGVITNVIVLPLCLVVLIGICVDKDLKFIRDQLDSIGFQTIDITEISDEKAVKHLREYFIVSLILVVIISSIYLIASALLIRGTNNVC